MSKQTAPRWSATATATATAALLLVGCGATPGQFLIVQDQVPDTASCVIPTTIGSVYRDVGNLDVRLVSRRAEAGYYMYPLLRNNLQPAAGGQIGDPNRIALSSYNVSLGLPADATSSPLAMLFGDLANSPQDSGLLRFSVPTSGSVASGGGYTSSGVPAIPGELARRIRDQGLLAGTSYAYVMATVRARGDTQNGSIESDPFVFPIRVCDGCLIASLQLCPATMEPANKGNPCNVAQDDPVDCCDSGAGLQCPPPVAVKAP
jgi:hypothetical protein